MNLEGNWPVYSGEKAIGQCEFIPQGLYWKMRCTIREGWEGISRLVLFSEKEPVSLGIPVPQGAVLTLERQIPRKGLPGEGEFYLELLPADAPLLSRRGKKVETPPEPSPTEDIPKAAPPESMPEEPPMKNPLPEPIPQEPPREEPLPEPIPQEPPMEEPLPEPMPEEPPREEPLPEPIPQEPPMEEPFPEPMPEEPPMENPLPEPIPQEPPMEEPLPEPMPEELPMEEPFSESMPQEPPMDEPLPEPMPEGIPFRPGDKLPPLENWRNFRVEPDGKGGFLLFQRP